MFSFGSNPTNTPNPFGSTTATTSTNNSSSFGMNPSNTQGNLFGNTAPTAAGTGTQGTSNLFGQQTTNAYGSSTGNVFGAAPNPTSANLFSSNFTGNSPFSSNVGGAQATGPFNFGAPASTTNLFSNPVAATPTGTNLFSTPAPTFSFGTTGKPVEGIPPVPTFSQGYYQGN